MSQDIHFIKTRNDLIYSIENEIETIFIEIITKLKNIKSYTSYKRETKKYFLQS